MNQRSTVRRGDTNSEREEKCTSASCNWMEVIKVVLKLMPVQLYMKTSVYYASFQKECNVPNEGYSQAS